MAAVVHTCEHGKIGAQLKTADTGAGNTRAGLAHPISPEGPGPMMSWAGSAVLLPLCSVYATPATGGGL